jgi:hypothetical protein
MKKIKLRWVILSLLVMGLFLSGCENRGEEKSQTIEAIEASARTIVGDNTNNQSKLEKLQTCRHLLDTTYEEILKISNNTVILRKYAKVSISVDSMITATTYLLSNERKIEIANLEENIAVLLGKASIYSHNDKFISELELRFETRPRLGSSQKDLDTLLAIQSDLHQWIKNNGIAIE